MLLTDFTSDEDKPPKPQLKLLFVCNSNVCRSRTFANYFKKNYPQIRVDSAGTHESADNMLTELRMTWADQIFVMDLEQAMYIHEKHPHHYDKVEIIGVSDQYDPGEPKLIDLIQFWLRQRNGYIPSYSEI